MQQLPSVVKGAGGPSSWRGAVQAAAPAVRWEAQARAPEAGRIVQCAKKRGGWRAAPLIRAESKPGSNCWSKSIESKRIQLEPKTPNRSQSTPSCSLEAQGASRKLTVLSRTVCGADRVDCRKSRATGLGPAGQPGRSAVKLTVTKKFPLAALPTGTVKESLCQQPACRSAETEMAIAPASTETAQTFTARCL